MGLKELTSSLLFLEMETPGNSHTTIVGKGEGGSFPRGSIAETGNTYILFLGYYYF